MESDVCYRVYGWSHLVKEVTTGVAENTDSLPPGGWLKVTRGLTACTPGSAPGPTLGKEYMGKLPFELLLSGNAHNVWHHRDHTATLGDVGYLLSAHIMRHDVTRGSGTNITR